MFQKRFKRWKTGAFSQYPRPSKYPTIKPNSDKPKLAEIRIMGYSIRTSRYRYTEWIKFEHFQPLWNTLIARELYDHFTDPNEIENLIGDEKLIPIIHLLSLALKNGWENSKPHFI